MKVPTRWMVVLCLLLAACAITACGGSADEAVHNEPAEIEPVAGSEFNAVVLTEKAAERLDIHSEPVSKQTVDGRTRMVVPYAAILYGLNGETWVYVRNPGPDSLRFVREPVTVDRIEGDTVMLISGPAVGTEVVTVGAAELYGTDTGVGK